MTYSIKKQNKYHNVRQNYNGNLYHSKKEATKAWELDMLIKAGEIKSYERQVKEELYGQNGTRVTNYFVDFVVYHNDGLKEYVEIKSPITATPVWKLKWYLLEDKYKDEISRGEIKLTVEY
jgi:hypothetical protein